jgi:molybdopterin converting factor subunit 1
MRINVKLFAILRERAGASEIALELRDGATIADARQQLSLELPSLRALIDRAAFAVNQTYAKPDVKLNEGDELALIPPVSGGRD